MFPPKIKSVTSFFLATKNVKTWTFPSFVPYIDVPIVTATKIKSNKKDKILFNHVKFHSRNYQNALIHNQAPMTLNQNGLMISIADRSYYRFSNILPIHEEPNNLPYAPSVYQNPSTASAITFQGQDNLAPHIPNIFVPVQHEASRNISPYSFDDREYQINVFKSLRLLSNSWATFIDILFVI